MNGLESLEPDQRTILLDALVTYADACTLPKLTPTCPFYRDTDSGPTCEEQCRSIAERNGVGDRPRHSAHIGGLVLHGRALPIGAASGSRAFDAQELYIAEKNHDYQQQSTTTLLMGLNAALRPPLLEGTLVDVERALQIWQELDRRGLPVESILRGGLVPHMAFAIAIRACMPYLLRAGALPPHMSVELQRELDEAGSGPWSRVLEDLTSSLEPVESRLARGQLRPIQPPEPLPLQLPTLSEAPGDATLKALLQYPAMTVAVSHEFVGRAEEWIARLLEEDLTAALRADAPPSSVFIALPSIHGGRDEGGLWLWERLTVTDPVNWSQSSLLLEWRLHRGELPDPYPTRVLAERTTSQGEIADLALEKLSRTSGRKRRARGLHPTHFVRQATEHLSRGEWERAVEIFRGLVDIRPADGDSWNNLGFCQLAGDPASALKSLEQASIYERDEPLINVVNRCLALHLLGRDDAALALAESSMHLHETGTQSAFLWKHVTMKRPLELERDCSPSQYLHELHRHIRDSECS